MVVTTQLTSLCRAAKIGNARNVRRFLREKDDAGKDVDLDERDLHRWTPLMLAADLGKRFVVAELLKRRPGPDTNAKDDEGKTALMRAAAKNFPRTVRMLLVAEDKAEVNYQDDNGETALVAAARKGNWAVVIILLNNRARVDLQTHDDETALHFAVRKQMYNGVRRLLRARGGSQAIEFRDSKGQTALHLAAKNGNLPITRELLRQGALDVADDLDHMASTLARNRGFHDVENTITNWP